MVYLEYRVLVEVEMIFPDGYYNKEEFRRDRDYLCSYCHYKAMICDITNKTHLCMFCFIYFVYKGCGKELK